MLPHLKEHFQGCTAPSPHWSRSPNSEGRCSPFAETHGSTHTAVSGQECGLAGWEPANHNQGPCLHPHSAPRNSSIWSLKNKKLGFE